MSERDLPRRGEGVARPHDRTPRPCDVRPAPGRQPARFRSTTRRARRRGSAVVLRTRLEVSAPRPRLPSRSTASPCSTRSEHHVRHAPPSRRRAPPLPSASTLSRPTRGPRRSTWSRSQGNHDAETNPVAFGRGLVRANRTGFEGGFPRHRAAAREAAPDAKSKGAPRPHLA